MNLLVINIVLNVTSLACILSNSNAGIAQLVERNLAKVEVASSNLVSRSTFTKTLSPLEQTLQPISLLRCQSLLLRLCYLSIGTK